MKKIRGYEAEHIALRRIRRHRHRRAAWRHMIAVRRARARLYGLALLALDLVAHVSFGEMSLLALIAGVALVFAPDIIA